jgi:hypothetical protein
LKSEFSALAESRADLTESITERSTADEIPVPAATLLGTKVAPAAGKLRRAAARFAHLSKDFIMVTLMLFGAIAFIANLRLVVKVWQVNAFFGIVTFFFFPVSIFFLFKHWGDPDHDIKLVFGVTLVASILTGYQFDMLKAQARQYSNAEETQSR